MTATSKIQVESDFEELEKKKHWFRVSLNMCRKQPLGVAGGIVVLLMIIMAVFAEFLAFYDPEVNSLEHMLLPPDEKYWLGKNWS